jgi:hypothetical protein
MLPRIQLLIALEAHLQAAVAQLPADERFKVRHHRHRDSDEGEWPCVAVRYVSDDTTGVTTGTDDPGPSMSETVMELSVDLVCDTALPAEVDAGEAAPDLDPTGLATLCNPIEVCLKSLFTEGLEPDSLGGTTWDIRYEGSGNDEASTPDTGRMVERLVLVYRVRADDPTYLLTGN